MCTQFAQSWHKMSPPKCQANCQNNKGCGIGQNRTNGSTRPSRQSVHVPHVQTSPQPLVTASSPPCRLILHVFGPRDDLGRPTLEVVIENDSLSTNPFVLGFGALTESSGSWAHRMEGRAVLVGACTDLGPSAEGALQVSTSLASRAVLVGLFQMLEPTAPQGQENELAGEKPAIRHQRMQARV
mmetsp:Transcript_17292/g.46873  ORF Transcript_17292/g.46873 Transcript_17292/m.46873 type:complete len:184 (-) Transcript_17292:1831-2382(-)